MSGTTRMGRAKNIELGKKSLFRAAALNSYRKNSPKGSKERADLSAAQKLNARAAKVHFQDAREAKRKGVR